MAEAELIPQIKRVLAAKGFVPFRNQVGLAKVHGQYVTTGLGTGSPDFVGWRRIRITPEMVGCDIAVFFGCEVKDGKARTDPDREKKQEDFRERLRRDGGIAILARSLEDVVGL